HLRQHYPSLPSGAFRARRAPAQKLALELAAHAVAATIPPPRPASSSQASKESPKHGIWRHRAKSRAHLQSRHWSAALPANPTPAVGAASMQLRLHPPARASMASWRETTRAHPIAPYPMVKITPRDSGARRGELHT